MRMLFHFCCAAILMFLWVPGKHQDKIHTLAQSQMKEASCRAFHRRLIRLRALVYTRCVSRGRGGDCSSCSSPQSELGQQFQGVLTRDSSSFVTRLLIFCLVIPLSLGVQGLLLGGVKSSGAPHFYPNHVTAAGQGDTYHWKSLP